MLANAVIILICNNLESTTTYYREKLGFRVVEHFENAEPFAATYRDKVEIVLVQAARGQFITNRDRYGAGFDAYLVPESHEAVRELFHEMEINGIKIEDPLTLTPYGSLEYSFQDCEGHTIGVGLIQNEKVFFGEAVN
jgi:catechol 2,3-dioxygenase-like lactoylglutathione lyase family enzyme